MVTRTPQQKRKRRYNDLSGNVYGHLTVLHRTDDDVSSSGHVQVKYRCSCDCGEECEIRASRLKAGNDNLSCGCQSKRLRSKSMTGRNFQNLTGQRFGRWVVKARAESVIEKTGAKATMWLCVCDCGTERELRAGSLKNGSTKSCGCLRRDVLTKDRDLTGKRIGKWVVAHRSPDVTAQGRIVRMWHCLCDCGSEKDVSEQSLVKDVSASCGCYRVERLREVATYEDLTGRVFNRWAVLGRAEDRFYEGGGRAQMWHCKCECGNTNTVAGGMLKNGISQSCGCLHGSVAEAHVRQYLDESGYTYKQQATFSDLVGVGGGLLSYDFLVEGVGSQTVLIECQGEQHYRPVDYFGGEARFEVQQEHDRRKREYASEKGMALLEISHSVRTYEAIAEVLAKGPFHDEVIGY